MEKRDVSYKAYKYRIFSDDNQLHLLNHDDTPMFATSFRGSNLTEEEESALDHLFDMMTAVKQQVLLRKALL